MLLLLQETQESHGQQLQRTRRLIDTGDAAMTLRLAGLTCENAPRGLVSLLVEKWYLMYEQRTIY